MKKILLVIGFFLVSINDVQAQGMNHTWLLGFVNVLDTNTMSTRGRILFDANNALVIGESRKMAFEEAQGNISDENGNLIAASNGCWIMDASGDTMLNGNGINSGPFTSSYCSSTSGMPFSNTCMFLPMPNDTNKYILLHQAPDLNTPYYVPGKVSYTVVDKTLNNNLGGVLNGQKNLIALQDTFIGGMAACRHANGRDWWIIAPKDSSNKLFKILLI